MITEKNNTESSLPSTIEIYENIGVSLISKETIEIDYSYSRAQNARFTIMLLIGIPFLACIFSYNLQSLLGLMGTLTFAIIMFIYSKNKYRIWHKTIRFDNVSKKIAYTSYFPKKNITLDYGDIKIISRTHSIKGNSFEYYYLLKKQQTEKEEKYALFAGSTNATDKETKFFVSLLEKYMYQNHLPDGLEPYQKVFQF